MTVSELILRLQEFDGDTEVGMRPSGYEAMLFPIVDVEEMDSLDGVVVGLAGD